MTLMAEIMVVLVLVGFIFWWIRQSNKDKNDFYENIPGPPKMPLLGNALDFKSTKELLQVLINYRKTYGDILTASIGPIRKFILVSNYEFLEFVLSSTKLLKKSEDYHFFEPWLGTGLLTSDGSKWKTHRRILTPAFHFQILEQFIEVFNSCSDTLVKKLREHVGKNSCDVYPLVTMCTLDVICESIMGISINAQEDHNTDYVKSVKDMCRIAMERSMSPVQMYDFLYPLSSNYYTQKKALKILHKQTNDVIHARKRELQNIKSRKDAETSNEFFKSKKPFLDLLLETEIDGKPLSHEEIREEVDTFMFEGHDTTASAISFTLFCLANHAEVQEKAFEEQKALFENTNNVKPKYADLQNMKYLDQVIKESLRLYPSVPFFGRETNDAVEFDNKVLPKGGTIVIFPYAIHRDPRYFKNPEIFDPDRFKNFDSKIPYAYIPFSAGPRNCIGQKFAMLEMKSAVSKILREYKLKPSFPLHELQLVSETILKSSNGVKISLELRK